MPRIRTIKPEFFSSPTVWELNEATDYLGGYVWQAMWCLSDDTGRGEYHPSVVWSFAFPNAFRSERKIGVAEVSRICAEISRLGAANFYEVAGRFYWSIPGWKNHQSRDIKTTKSKYPSPEEGTPIDPESLQVKDSRGEFAKSRGTFAKDRGNFATGTGEQGNRGTGEQEIMINPADAGSIDTTTLDQLFNEFWAAYPRHVGKKAARTKFATATKTTDPKTIIEGAKAYAEAVKDSDPTYIAHPTTWLNQGRWEDETPQPKTATSSINDWLPATTTTPIVEAEVTQLTWDDELPPAHKHTKIGW